MGKEHRCEAMVGQVFWIGYDEELNRWVLNVAGCTKEPITHCPFCGVELSTGKMRIGTPPQEWQRGGGAWLT